MNVVQEQVRELRDEAGDVQQGAPVAAAQSVQGDSMFAGDTPASLVGQTPLDGAHWHTQLQRTGPQDLSFTSPSSRANSAPTRRPSVTGPHQRWPTATPLSAHINALHHRLNTPASTAAGGRPTPGSALGSASSLSRSWTAGAWLCASPQSTPAGLLDRVQASGLSSTPAAEALNPLFDDSGSGSKPTGDQEPVVEAAQGPIIAGADIAKTPQEELLPQQQQMSEATAAKAGPAEAAPLQKQLSELQAQLAAALRQNAALVQAQETAAAAAQAARDEAAKVAEEGAAARLVSAQLSLQLEAAHEQLSLARKQAQIASLVPHAGDTLSQTSLQKLLNPL